MRVFVLVWFGQLVSLTGSGLTEFALGVWVYQRTGSPTRFALAALCIAVPRILLAPLAGTLVDRWDRRRAMLLSDAGSAFCTLIVALLVLTGRLAVGHVYLLVAASSAFGAFHSPAYVAATTLLVPKQHYGRASGMIGLTRSIASLVAPALAGFLIVTSGLATVILVDFATFLFAVLTLLVVRFPRPQPSAEGAAARGSLVREAAQGWAYIVNRPGLLGLLVVYAATSFLGITTEVLLAPYLLSFTTADVLGLVLSVSGIGLLVGSFIMGAWGGPKRRIYGIIGFEMLVGVCTALIGLRLPTLLLGVVVFLYYVGIELSDSCSQALWQSKVAADLQGRVFALRGMISWSALPLGLLVAAPLAEYVFEPALAAGGLWAGSVGRVIGIGPGRGIGLLFVLAGAFNVLALLAGYLYPRIRRVEVELPDAVGDANQGPG